MTTLPISVVIPVYNRRDRILATVDSVLGQDQLSVESVIVVDDASTDDSAEIAASHAACEVVRLRDNGGSAAARNAGLERVTTPWVSFLDSDDLWHPDLLGTLWPHTTTNVLVSGSALLKVEGKTLTLLGAPHESGQQLRSPYDVLVPANPIVTSATMVRTDIAKRLGGFDTSLRYSEDLDLRLRVLEHGSGWCDGAPVVSYHRDATSKSQGAHGGVERARSQIARRYGSALWWTPSGCERYLGGMYWEEARSAMRGRQWTLVRDYLRRSMRNPHRIRGAVESVNRNRRLRRRAAGARARGTR